SSALGSFASLERWRTGKQMNSPFARSEGKLDADDQPVDPQTAATEDIPRKVAPSRRLPAEARRMHARLYDDPEEAQLGSAQGRQGASDQWLRGYRLHSRRRPQSARALGGDDPRRARKGSSGRSLSHFARRARHAG